MVFPLKPPFSYGFSNTILGLRTGHTSVFPGMVDLPDIESAVRMGDIFAQLVERLGEAVAELEPLRCAAWNRGEVVK